MISTTVKKSLNKLKFHREIELPDFASKSTIPIRHLNIGFDGKEIENLEENNDKSKSEEKD